MAGIEDLRAKFPQYENVSDNDLVLAVYNKFYPNLSPEIFGERIGLNLKQFNSIFKSNETVEQTDQNEEKIYAPTQRTRTAAQGLTFGFGDEIEAGTRALFSEKTYDEELQRVRKSIKAYKKDYPIESVAFEVAGAALPALLPGGQASLARAIGVGALQGAAYGVGTGDGDLPSRLARAPGAFAGGALGGSAGYGLAKAGGFAINKLADSARRVLGRRGAKIVQTEIQRLVDQTGKTYDEITQDIIDGKLLAENKTIQAAVRSLRTSGGKASTIIQQGLEGRPAKTRTDVMLEMRKNLGNAGEGSQVAVRRESESLSKAAQKAAYSPLEGVPATPEVVEALMDALQRVPGAGKEATKAVLAKTGSKFFEIAKDGTVTFTRNPTAMEAEVVRRSIANRATKDFKNDSGASADAISDVEKELRGILDFNIKDLSSARAQAAAIFADAKAYKAGSNALVGDVNEKIADFATLSAKSNAAETIAAYRAGFMKLLENKMTTTSKNSFMRNLLDPAQKEGKLLREIFPADELPIVLKSIETAVDSQTAASKILIGTGSDTAGDIKETALRAMNISPAQIAGATMGSAVDTLGIAAKLIRVISRRELSSAENERIAKILVSSDPNLVRNALTDESAWQEIANRIKSLTQKALRAGGMGGRSQGAPIAGDISEGLLSPLLIDINRDSYVPEDLK